MATVLTHAFVGGALGAAYASRGMPPRFWVLAIACPMLADADVISFHLGIRYGDLLGHRGLTHSLPFALALAVVAAVMVRRSPGVRRSLLSLFAVFSAICASHGIIDAMTNGGLGVALLSPFDTTRYFLPWRVIQVAPIGFRYFVSRWGWEALASEMLWVWLPVGTFAAFCLAVKLLRNSCNPKHP